MSDGSVVFASWLLIQSLISLNFTIDLIVTVVCCADIPEEATLSVCIVAFARIFLFPSSINDRLRAWALHLIPARKEVDTIRPPLEKLRYHPQRVVCQVLMISRKKHNTIP